MQQKLFKKISYGLILFSEIFLILYFIDTQAIAKESVNKILTSKSTNNSSTVNHKPTVKKPQLPDRGIPTGRRRGGTSRSDCPVLDKSLTALVPGEEAIKNSSSKSTNQKQDLNDSQSFLTPTIRKYPTFWVYVPQLTNSTQTGEFILQNEQNRDIYRSLINLPSKSGILGIKLPQKSKNALKTGQKFHWYFKVYCGNQNNSEYLYVDAWIKKIAPNSITKEQLDVDKINNYQIYLNNNLWYEAIDNLANQQLKNRQKKEWYKLLDLLDLADLSNENILSPKANFLVK
jgi:hypothetical protein